MEISALLASRADADHQPARGKGRTAPRTSSPHRAQFRQAAQEKVAAPSGAACCTRVYTTTPKKPHSALRKVARVRLTNGMEVTVYIPGDRPQPPDTRSCSSAAAGSRPAWRALQVVRGRLDASGVSDRKKARSQYGVKAGSAAQSRAQLRPIEPDAIHQFAPGPAGHHKVMLDGKKSTASGSSTTRWRSSPSAAARIPSSRSRPRSRP